MQNTVARTQSYWIGMAGDAKREEFAEQKADVEEILTLFSKYPQDLLEMADLYVAAETKVTNQSAALPSKFLD